MANDLGGVDEILRVVSALGTAPLGDSPVTDNPHVAIVVEGSADKQLEILELVVGRRPLGSGLASRAIPDKVWVQGRQLG